VDPPGELGRQPGLADPRLAAHQHAAPLTGRRFLPGAAEQVDL
jgi:hypothetical protein